MSFVRIESRMPTGPKFDRIPSSAGWLYVAALCYSAANLTDGFIPAGQVHKLTNDDRRAVNRAIEWLTSTRPGCSNPLWRCTNGGWLVHDYADSVYGNPTRAVAEVLKEAGRKGGQRSVHVRRMRYGTAQPSSTPEASPEASVQSASTEASPEAQVGSLPEARTDPTRTDVLTHMHSARARVREESQLSPRAVELVQGFQALGYPQPSATDLMKAEEFVAELTVMTVPEILARMAQHLEHCEERHRPKPRTLGGFWNTLRSENDFRRDNGAQPAAPRESPNGAMTSIGSLLPKPASL